MSAPRSFHWGVTEENILTVKGTQIGSICPYINETFLGVTLKGIVHFSVEKVIAYYSTKVLSVIYIKEYNIVIGILADSHEFIAFHKNNLFNPILIDGPACEDVSALHMIFSPKSSILITCGDQITTYNLKYTPVPESVEFVPARVSMTKKGSILLKDSTSILNPPVLNPKWEILYVNKTDEKCVNAYSLNGQLIERLIPLMCKSKTVIDYHHKSTMFVTASHDYGVLYHNSIGRILNQYYVSLVSPYALRFFDEEHVLMFETNGNISVLDVNTGNVVSVYRTNDIVKRIYVFGEIVILCIRANIIILRPFFNWRHWANTNSKPLMIQQVKKVGAPNRILAMCTQSYMQIQETSGKILTSLTLISTSNPLTVYYDRSVEYGVNRELLLIPDDHGKLYLYSPKSSPCEKIKVIEARATGLTFCKVNGKPFYVFSCNSGHIVFYDYLNMKLQKMVYISSESLYGLFYSELNECLILMFREKVQRFDLKTMKIMEFVRVSMSNVNIFFNNSVVFGYETGQFGIVGFDYYGNELQVSHSSGDHYHNGKVTGFGLGYDYFISSSVDGTLKVWDKEFQLMYSLSFPFPLYACCVLDKSRKMLVGTEKEIMVVNSPFRDEDPPDDFKFHKLYDHFRDPLSITYSGEEEEEEKESLLEAVKRMEEEKRLEEEKKENELKAHLKRFKFTHQEFNKEVKEPEEQQEKDLTDAEKRQLLQEMSSITEAKEIARKKADAEAEKARLKAKEERKEEEDYEEEVEEESESESLDEDPTKNTQNSEEEERKSKSKKKAIKEADVEEEKLEELDDDEISDEEINFDALFEPIQVVHEPKVVKKVVPRKQNSKKISKKATKRVAKNKREIINQGDTLIYDDDNETQQEEQDESSIKDGNTSKLGKGKKRKAHKEKSPKNTSLDKKKSSKIKKEKSSSKISKQTPKKKGIRQETQNTQKDENSETKDEATYQENLVDDNDEEEYDYEYSSYYYEYYDYYYEEEENEEETNESEQQQKQNMQDKGKEAKTTNKRRIRKIHYHIRKKSPDDYIYARSNQEGVNEHEKQEIFHRKRRVRKGHNNTLEDQDKENDYSGSYEEDVYESDTYTQNDHKTGGNSHHRSLRERSHRKYLRGTSHNREENESSNNENQNESSHHKSTRERSHHRYLRGTSHHREENEKSHHRRSKESSHYKNTRESSIHDGLIEGEYQGGSKEEEDYYSANDENISDENGNNKDEIVIKEPNSTRKSKSPRNIETAKSKYRSKGKNNNHSPSNNKRDSSKTVSSALHNRKSITASGFRKYNKVPRDNNNPSILKMKEPNFVNEKGDIQNKLNSEQRIKRFPSPNFRREYNCKFPIYPIKRKRMRAFTPLKKCKADLIPHGVVFDVEYLKKLISEGNTQYLPILEALHFGPISIPPKNTINSQSIIPEAEEDRPNTCMPLSIKPEIRSFNIITPKPEIKSFHTITPRPETFVPTPSNAYRGDFSRLPERFNLFRPRQNLYTVPISIDETEQTPVEKEHYFRRRIGTAKADNKTVNERNFASHIRENKTKDGIVTIQESTLEHILPPLEQRTTPRRYLTAPHTSYTRRLKTAGQTPRITAPSTAYEGFRVSTHRITIDFIGRKPIKHIPFNRYRPPLVDRRKRVIHYYY